MHGTCFRQYSQTNFACPICRKSIVDPKFFAGFFEMQIAQMPMPSEYQNKLMTVQCNDCLAKSNVPFHIVGGKCSQCGSYNTSRVGDELIDDADKVVAQAAQDAGPNRGQPDGDWETDGEEEMADEEGQADDDN